MQERITTIYCLCDEVLKADGFVDLPGTAMSTAEVMTTALVAADLFEGCFERSRHFLHAHGYIPHLLSKSRFNRRLHALPEGRWQRLLSLLSAAAKQTNRTGEYLVDSCPVLLATTSAFAAVISIEAKRIGAISPVNIAISLVYAFISW